MKVKGLYKSLEYNQYTSLLDYFVSFGELIGNKKLEMIYEYSFISSTVFILAVVFYRGKNAQGEGESLKNSIHRRVPQKWNRLNRGLAFVVLLTNNNTENGYYELDNQFCEHIGYLLGLKYPLKKLEYQQVRPIIIFGEETPLRQLIKSVVYQSCLYYRGLPHRYGAVAVSLGPEGGEVCDGNRPSHYDFLANARGLNITPEEQRRMVVIYKLEFGRTCPGTLNHGRWFTVTIAARSLSVIDDIRAQKPINWNDLILQVVPGRDSSSDRNILLYVRPTARLLYGQDLGVPSGIIRIVGGLTFIIIGLGGRLYAVCVAISSIIRSKKNGGGG